MQHKKPKKTRGTNRQPSTPSLPAVSQQPQASTGQEQKPAEEPRPLSHKDDPILPLKEVSRQTGRSRDTIRKLIREGIIEAGRYPGSIRCQGVRQSQVDYFLSLFPSHKRITSQRRTKPDA